MTSSVQNSSLDVFCDWLDTTYSAESPVISNVQDFLQRHGGDCFYSDDDSSKYRIGNDDNSGVVVLETRNRYSRVSASGTAISYFRTLGVFHDYLSELSSEPHNVSRLDAALDLPLDGADVVDAMRKRFSVAGVGCQLGTKYLPVSYFLGVRGDGRETGTFYAGHRTRARTTARVYDKAWEMFCKRKISIPPTTRYEVTSRGEKGRLGPSLRDAAEPERLFWHIASPELLKAPDGVPAWSSGWEGGWSYESPESLLPAEALEKIIEYSPALNQMIEKADEMGTGGRKYMLRLLERKLGLSTF